jgi:hypothetical protein
MTHAQYTAKLQVLSEISRTITLSESTERTKLLEALWALHGTVSGEEDQGGSNAVA